VVFGSNHSDLINFSGKYLNRVFLQPFARRLVTRSEDIAVNQENAGNGFYIFFHMIGSPVFTKLS